MCASAGAWVRFAAHTSHVVHAETAVDGRRVAVEIQRGGVEQPAFIRIRVPVDIQRGDGGGAYRRPSWKPVMTEATAVVRRKTGADRLGLRLGLIRHRRTGDAALDAQVSIDTDASAETLAIVLGDATALAALARLFGAGLDRLEILAGRAELTAVFRDPAPARVAALPEVARDLVTLTAALPDLAPGAVGRLRPLRGVALPIVLVAIGMAALGTAMHLHDSTRVVDGGATRTLIYIGLPAWIPLRRAVPRPPGPLPAVLRLRVFIGGPPARGARSVGRYGDVAQRSPRRRAGAVPRHPRPRRDHDGAPGTDHVPLGDAPIVAPRPARRALPPPAREGRALRARPAHQSPDEARPLRVGVDLRRGSSSRCQAPRKPHRSASAGGRLVFYGELAVSSDFTRHTTGAARTGATASIAGAAPPAARDP